MQPTPAPTGTDLYFSTVAAHKAAAERREALLRELTKPPSRLNIPGVPNEGMSREDARKQPEYVALDQESSRLYWEADALTPNVIRANLERLGLQDMQVVGTLVARNRTTTIDAAEMLLSDLCGMRYHGLAKHLGDDAEDVDFNIVIEFNGRAIGFVDSDGGFHFEAASDLKTALGWKIATDGGRVRLLENVDLDARSDEILAVIKERGTSRETFSGPMSDVLRRAFVCDLTSRTSDGHLAAKTVLWRVATRQLGEWHEGYPFMM